MQNQYVNKSINDFACGINFRKFLWVVSILQRKVHSYYISLFIFYLIASLFLYFLSGSGQVLDWLQIEFRGSRHV